MLPLSDRPRGPLHGVQVLDLTRVLAGPYCSLMLWELGAEVLKIERPGHGDDTRAFPPFQNGESVYFASVNRGKRSLALDLRAPGDRAVFEDLLSRADVLVENFRPGAMERLGYGWDKVRALAPRVVFARISGFGQTGPYRDRPAYDLVVQAIGGMMSINGPEGGPGHRLGISLGDTGAGLFAALAITAALFERRVSGEGRLVDVSMLECQTALLEAALVRYFATGVSGRPTGSRHPVISPFDVFQTADAPIAIGCANDELFAAFARCLDRPDWITSDRFGSLPQRYVHHAELKREIEAVLTTRSARDWLAHLSEAEIPCAPLQDMAQVAVDPQLAARGAFIEVEDPEMGRLRMSGSPFHISGYERSGTRPPAPNLDEARESVLDELRRTRVKRAPLPPAW